MRESDLLEDEIREVTTPKRKGRQKNPRGIALGLVATLAIVLLAVGMGVGITYIAKKNEAEITEAEAEAEILYTQEEMQEQIEQMLAEGTAGGRAEVLEELKQQLMVADSAVEVIRQFYEDDLVLVSNGAYHFVPIQKDLKLNQYQDENLTILENGELQYAENGQVISHKGIDVSKFQGNIDWNQVAQDGVEFAFIRVGNRGYGSGKMVEDEMFEANVEGALTAGIKVGVYFYSQAITEEEVLEEANFVLQKIAPYRIECPIVFDVEKVSGDDGRMNALTPEERTNLTLLFCETIENAGYKPMIYFNLEMSALMLQMERLEAYDKWFAYYNKNFYFPYDYKVWQYTEKGNVAGVKGEVDLNISFAPLW